MAKKTEASWWNDPIAREQRERERDEFRRELFLPISPLTTGYIWNVKWLVEGLIPRSYLVMLAAPPKSGKTCLATAIALAVASGVPFAGRKTEQSGVLWIAGEENPYERNLFLNTSPLADPSIPLHTCHQPFQIDNPDYLDALAYWVRETQAGLIVVDPLMGSIAGRSLTDGWAARKTLKALKQFCHDKKLAALVLHHTKRDERSYFQARVADSAQIAATASMNIVLSSRPAPELGDTPDQAASISNEPPVDALCELTQNLKARKEDGPKIDPQSPNASTLQSPSASTPQSPGASTPQGPNAPTPRLLSLSCTGRGAWANGTYHLISFAPLDYRPTERQRNEEWPAPELRHSEMAIINLLAEGDKTTDDMFESLISLTARYETQ